MSPWVAMASPQRDTSRFDPLAPKWSAAGPLAARHLSNQELLTRVLDGYGGKADRIARRFLDQFGSWRGLAGASRADLDAVQGARPAHVARLEACLELGRRLSYGRPLPRWRVDGPADVARLLMPMLRDADREHFVAVLLSTKNHILDVVTVSIGTLSASIVHPREVWKPAIQASAAAVIVAHNHPTGVPTPSPEDVELTRRLARCGELIGIRLLDHVIVGDGTYESLKEGGYF
jgi:DNA repair protein RadC